MTLAIIDYGSGNLRSAAKAFDHAAKQAGLSLAITVTADPAVAAKADRLVLPGVGAFGDCMAGLAAIPGMIETLTARVQDAGVPFMGICVGMQLLATRGLEHGTHKGLGWIGGEVGPLDLPANARDLKIPHMGWNEIRQDRPHPVLDGLDGEHAYFVHSYVMTLADPRDQLAHADYGAPFTAIIARDNIIATQFHPEKSQRVGQALIKNFLNWTPT